MSNAAPLALALALAALAAGARAQDEDDDESPAQLRQKIKRMETKRRVLWGSGRYDETGFRRMAAPKDGEWLARFPERGQTFEEYKARCANKRRKGRETIYVRPFGPLGARAKAAIEPVRAFSEAFFGIAMKVLEEQPLPNKAYVKKRDQYDEAPIMVVLRGEREDDALMHVGLADKDLFSDDLNFVFGVGSLEDRVGVYSLRRFDEGGTPEKVYRRRAFQLVAHELGHILSMEHCIFYECVMNGSNSLEESDAAPCHLCPVCLSKLEWNVGFDRATRYRALEKVYEAEGLADEARWCDERAKKLEPAPESRPSRF